MIFIDSLIRKLDADLRNTLFISRFHLKNVTESNFVDE